MATKREAIAREKANAERLSREINAEIEALILGTKRVGGKESLMYWVVLSVFQQYSAFLTARSKNEVLTLFAQVVKDAISQYENVFLCVIAPCRKDKISADMQRLQASPPEALDDLSYDMLIDGDGLTGLVYVNRVFTEKAAVCDAFQPWVDELNAESGLSDDEKWSVFGGGFFPEESGYELDELFK